MSRQSWNGIECQTGFNASLSCIILGVDADDQKPQTLIRDLITTYELYCKTIIQKTLHCGLHLLVKIPCKIEDIETWRKRALYLHMCKDISVLTEVRRRTAKGFVEATFHIPEDVMRALKMKAVQENKRFSKVAEDALRQYLELPKEKVKKQK
jgi:hypothetical protein